MQYSLSKNVQKIVLLCVLCGGGGDQAKPGGGAAQCGADATLSLPVHRLHGRGIIQYTDKNENQIFLIYKLQSQCWTLPLPVHRLHGRGIVLYTDKKETQIFLIYKENQTVKKSVIYD
jgi:hypothetical protein